MIPEPKDKLDAATFVVVIGPGDATLDWQPGCGERTEVGSADLHGIEGGDLARVRRRSPAGATGHSSLAATVGPLPPEGVSPVTRTVAATVPGTSVKLADVALGPTMISSSRPSLRSA